MLREDVLTKLIKIDEEIYYTYGDKRSFSFTIVGGSALILNFNSTRATPDIDVLSINSAVANIASKYDMNCRVKAYELNFPYNYEDRLVPVGGYDFKVCKFYTPSLEDLVVSKIAAFREKDKEDLNSNYVLKKLNWDKLIKIVEIDKEFEKANISQIEISSFMLKYKGYKEGHYKK